jgi:outer membrane protein assembly factor BamD
MRILLLPVFALLFTLLSACSGDGNERPDELTEREYYEKAVEAIEDENYLLAVETLQKLESRYPFGVYTEQAQLEMIYAQYQSQELESAKAAAERFIRLHPEHANVDYAYYMKGLITNHMGLSLVERYLADEQNMRDPQPAREAFQEFTELIRKFPDSPYVSDAHQRMIHLRNRLAHYEVHVGQYYLKRHAFMAAVNRGKHIVETYQGTDRIGDGLALMVEGYQHLGMDDLAAKSLKVLKLNYPNHPQLENGKFTHSGFAEKDHRSLLNVVTFGLLG